MMRLCTCLALQILVLIILLAAAFYFDDYKVKYTLVLVCLSLAELETIVSRWRTVENRKTAHTVERGWRKDNG